MDTPTRPPRASRAPSEAEEAAGGGASSGQALAGATATTEVAADDSGTAADPAQGSGEDVDWSALDSAAPGRPVRPPANVIIAGAATALGGALALGLGLWLVLAASQQRSVRVPLSRPAGGGGSTSSAGTARPDLPTMSQPGTGAHDLVGAVVDTSGAPVAAAVITARFELGPGLETVDAEGLELTPEIVAISDGSGAFRLLGLEAGHYRLLVEAPGIFTSEVRLVEVPGGAARIIVARRVAVEGVLRDPSGDAVGVPVMLRGDAIVGDRVFAAGAGGAFAFSDLPEGVYTVWAGEGLRAAPSIRVDRLGVGPFPQVELTLAAGYVLEGRVVERGRELGVAAAVSLHATDSREPSRYVRTAADGSFSIEALVPGRYRVEAQAPGFTALESLEVRPERGTRPTVELIRGGVVEGRVVDHAGVPVPGAEIQLFGETREGLSVERSEAIDQEALVIASGMGSRTAATDPETEGEVTSTGNVFIPRGELGVLRGPIPPLPPPGSAATRIARIVAGELTAPGDGGGPGVAAAGGVATVAPLTALPELESTYRTDAQGRFRVAGLSTGTYRVRAQATGFAAGESVSFAASVGLTIDAVEVRLSRGVHLFGVISDQHGAPVGGARVAAVGGDQKLGAIRLETIAEPDGSYRIGPFAGAVTVVATAAGHGEASARRVLENTASLASEERLDLVIIAADQEIRGSVSDANRGAIAGAKVSLTIPQTGTSGRVRTELSNAAGDFVFERLPEGRYELHIAAAGFPPKVIEIATSRERRDLVLDYGGGIEVLVRDAHTGSPLVGATVAGKGPSPGDAMDRLSAERGETKLAPLSVGTWNLRVALDGYVPARLRVEVPAGRSAGEITVRDQVVELERGAIVAGTVRDGYGERVAGAAVTVGELVARTDEDGAFRLIDVPTGTTTLIAARDGLVGEIEVTLRPGDELVTLEIKIQ